MGGTCGPGAPAAWHDDQVVGREELVEELVRFARAAVGGSSSVVVLAGEAGIGKTSIARAVAHAVRDELHLSWGSCSADRSAPPFWPWRPLLDPLLDTPPASVDPPHPEAARYDQLNDLRDRLLVGHEPRLHLIEDLQWADVASVLLLGQVASGAATGTLAVVATLRSGEDIGRPLEAALEAVRRQAHVVDVPPLPDAAIEVLMRGNGLPRDPELATLLRDRTGGNPLFVTELLRACRGAEGADHLRVLVGGSVPARAAELVRDRLARLPDPVEELVVSASVVGAEGDVRLLAAISGTAVEAVVEQLEQARAARLMDVATPGRWRFHHELVRDAVYATMSDAERARTHVAALDALAVDPSVPPAVLARHAIAAQPLLDAERAVDLAVRAGASAADLHADEEAVDWFREALSVGSSAIGSRRRADLLVRCGDAHRRLGELELAQAAFLDAAALTSDPELVARSALGFADPGADLGIAYRADDPTTVQLLERAIDLQADEGSATSVLLRSRLAAELYFSETPGRARSLAEAALAAARRLDDDRAFVAAGAVVHDAFVVGQADLAAQLHGSAELLERAGRSGSAATLLTAHRARVLDLLAAGDLAAVDAQVLAFRRAAEPLGAPGYLWWPALWGAMRSLLDGDHDLAEARALEAHALGDRAFPSLAITNLSFLLFFLRREQGRLAEMEAPTREYAASHADVPAIRVALVLLLAEIGRIDEARGLIDAIAAEDLERLRDRNWPASWFQLARATSLVGHRDLAERLLDERHRPTERCVTVSLATVCLGATDLAAAWLLRTTGDLDGAVRCCIAATEVNGRIGARSWSAQARADHAALLVERDGPGDRRQAAELLALAAGAAEEIGLPRLEPQLAALRAALGPPVAGEAAPRPTPAGGRFRRRGQVWHLEYAGRAVDVPHTRGLGDLAHLLAHPGEAISVLELQHDVPGAAEVVRGAPALDERARREIAARLRALDDEEADAEAANDPDRAAVAREQRQVLAEEVARDLGLGGRSRRVDDPIERARKTVSTRIRRTIAAIGRIHPELGRHLERSVDTGTWCAYRPAEPVTWTT